MSARAIRFGVLSFGLGLCISFGIDHPAQAQSGPGVFQREVDLPRDLLPNVKNFERTDLFDSSSWLLREQYLGRQSFRRMTPPEIVSGPGRHGSRRFVLKPVPAAL